ncbi:hypothetical protein P280DRAFT_92136 [Massarina eburnea CBS 473.64]|uniref:Uncharacterized protein n=1 Tax=Massarina eburnea CBS 473.64 TaxID=1395130 RepID=A0A6A6RUU0_9PLEO|nr:hypothetical protein P280DRAFT_92136 [Massarina eburnea CBS 473.64]
MTLVPTVTLLGWRATSYITPIASPLLQPPRALFDIAVSATVPDTSSAVQCAVPLSQPIDRSIAVQIAFTWPPGITNLLLRVARGRHPLTARFCRNNNIWGASPEQ